MHSIISSVASRQVHAGDTGPLVVLLRAREPAEGAGRGTATTILPSQGSAAGLLSLLTKSNCLVGACEKKAVL